MDPDLVVLQLAQDLSELPEPAGFREVALERLAELFPCDHVFWTRTDFVHAEAEVQVRDGDAAGLGAALGVHGLTHPAIQTYVSEPRDLCPRRMSDVATRREWQRTPVYAEAFAPFGPAHQLSMVCSVSLPGTGTGWTMTRSGSDFSDAELDLARRVLPVLVVLERWHARPSAARPPRLTPRERQVLLALADGLTAAAIGRRHGITERTVRKHLAALYDKLACHDRLLAVERSRELGLLPAAHGAKGRLRAP